MPGANAAPAGTGDAPTGRPGGIVGSPACGGAGSGRVTGGAVHRGPVARAGSYVLQVGSYRKFEEADRVRAQLALQGIESKVQRVSVDSDTWHRVRIGPISDLKTLDRVRQRLREAEMDVLVIRVGD